MITIPPWSLTSPFFTLSSMLLFLHLQIGLLLPLSNFSLITISCLRKTKQSPPCSQGISIFITPWWWVSPLAVWPAIDKKWNAVICFLQVNVQLHSLCLCSCSGVCYVNFIICLCLHTCEHKHPTECHMSFHCFSRCLHIIPLEYIRAI